jgi:hypothetical protein
MSVLTTTLSDSYNDQGIFHDDGEKRVNQVPTVELAFFSNKYENKQIDEVVNLNAIHLNWCDFTTLFFAPSAKAFYISPTNSLNKAISFYNQTYETTQNANVTFNLADQIKKTWSKKTSKPESLIPPETNIQLSRQGFLTKTLRSIKGKVVALSLDEALNTLLSNDLIVPADSDSSATVRFVISYADTFEPLDTTVMVNFSYRTKIPCYKNVNECESFCPYSKDTKPSRHDFDEKTYRCDLDDKLSHKGDFDENASVMSEDKSVISGLTELINANKTVSTENSW